MHEQIFVGIDAGTSQFKCAAFTAAGYELAVSVCENKYHTGTDGSVEQNAQSTRELMLTTLAELVNKLGADAQNIIGIGITAMGDGMLLVDAAGVPIHDGWLWLDSRASDVATTIERKSNYDEIFKVTGTAINASQMRSQLLWLEQNNPALLDEAHTAYHWKDYLYFCLTGVRATDPSEALFTFGSFKSGSYDDKIIEALGLSHRAHLLPPIVDGMEQCHLLLTDVATRVGLEQSIPVSLGYVDVICSALGGGLYNNGAASAMTIMGTTGIHMRYAGSAAEVQLPEQNTGYTIAFPGGGFVQLQTNLAATINIDWVLNLAVEAITAQSYEITRDDILSTLDSHIENTTAGSVLYQPYISNAGERGPFFNTNARASFEGLDNSTGYYDLVRSVIEGMCLAARDCYESLGDIPAEVRLTGGASQSKAIQGILASVLNRPVRVTEIQESGSAGAAMIAAMQQGLYDNLSSCASVWLDDKLGEPVHPSTALAAHYNALFGVYLSKRKNQINSGLWEQLATIDNQHVKHNND